MAKRNNRVPLNGTLYGRKGRRCPTEVWDGTAAAWEFKDKKVKVDLNFFLSGLVVDKYCSYYVRVIFIDVC